MELVHYNAFARSTRLIELSEQASDLNLQPGDQLKITVLRKRNQTSKVQDMQPLLTSRQRAEGFRAWADGHTISTPALSDEDISRESIYGERG